MKERPIIVSGEMVRAILEGRETQTTRVIKPQPTWKERLPDSLQAAGWFWQSRKRCVYEAYQTKSLSLDLVKHCPYGVIGDRLWVKETWGAYCEIVDGYDDLYGVCYKQDMCYVEPERRAANYFRLSTETRDMFWRSPYHMPKWATRIWLEITNIRVERLKGEYYLYDDEILESGIVTVRKIINPWVWVIEFKRAAE